MQTFEYSSLQELSGYTDVSITELLNLMNKQSITPLKSEKNTETDFEVLCNRKIVSESMKLEMSQKKILETEFVPSSSDIISKNVGKHKIVSAFF